VDVLSMSF